MKDTITAEFTQFDNSSNWVYGKTSNGYGFEAKHYDMPSDFGIKKGRVSKLWISKKGEGCVVNYDRGWDVRVSKDFRPTFNVIMKLLENAPKRF